MKKLKNQIMQIVADVLGDDSNGVYLSNDGAYYGTDQNLIAHFDTEDPRFLDLDNENFEITTGATKLVIIPFNKNYVIKIPFTHLYGYDEETQLFTYTKANANICDEENVMYDEASEELQEILLPNIYIGMYNDCIPVYIQKKVANLGCRKLIRIGDRSPAYQQIAQYLYNLNYCPVALEVLLPYLHKVGMRRFVRLLRDICNISDLHYSNWGTLKDGSLAIMDYGGYDPNYLYD